MSRQHIAAVLRQLRLKSGMTAREVAEIVGKSDKTVGAWENGRGQPDLDMLLRLCDLYAVEDVQAVFGEKKRRAAPTTKEEQAVLAGYRGLDGYGKELIRLILQKETERCKTPLPLRDQEFGNVAARDGGVRTPDPEELRDMEAVYQNLILPQKKRGNKGE